ncbi:hypothetical protein SAMN06265347_10477 [Halobellus salinus]|nr:hypothetical protein SAMN06265347_10477 [Halobellus salinus]
MIFLSQRIFSRGNYSVSILGDHILESLFNKILRMDHSVMLYMYHPILIQQAKPMQNLQQLKKFGKRDGMTIFTLYHRKRW